MIELVFVIYLYSGFAKQVLGIVGVGLPDLTALSAVATLALAAPRLSLAHFKLAVPRTLTVILAVFYWWMLTTLFYTSSAGYAWEKAVFFLTCVFAAAVPLVVRGFDAQRFLRWFVGVGAVLSFTTIAVLPQVFSGSVGLTAGEFRSVYLNSAYMSGLNVLLALFVVKGLSRPVAIALGLLFIAMTFLAGGRGPLLFAVLLVAMGLADLRGASRRLGGYLWLVPVAAVVAGLFFENAVTGLWGEQTGLLIDRSVERLLRLSEEGGLSSRTTLFSFALDFVLRDGWTMMFGAGIGSFGQEYHGVDIKSYPHNIFLEVWFEMGMIGLILMVALWARVFLLWMYERNVPALLVFSYLLLNAMKSSSLVDSRVLFGMVTVLLLMTLARRSQAAAAPAATPAPAGPSGPLRPAPRFAGRRLKA